MAFFNKFPLTRYVFDQNKSSSSVAVNLLTSAKFMDLMPERSEKCYVDYLVVDGEKAEHIAHRVYGNSNYHWIVFMANQIYNPYFDWPLSSWELDDYIEKKYKGSALFYDCIGSEATQFKIKNTNTFLPEIKSHFIVGNTLTQVQGTRTIIGTIIEWNPTYRKLVVDDINGGAFSASYVTTSTNKDNIEFEATPKKTMISNADTVHHFVDDFANYLDPFAKINYYEYDDNRIFARRNVFFNNNDGIPTYSNVGNTGINDFMLNKYINGNQNNTITNRMYESIQNDYRRHVKILRKEYSGTIVRQLETIFK
jgi:hypothetical protein